VLGLLRGTALIGNEATPDRPGLGAVLALKVHQSAFHFSIAKLAFANLHSCFCTRFVRSTSRRKQVSEGERP
jgi:hypothetical protein